MSDSAISRELTFTARWPLRNLLGAKSADLLVHIQWHWFARVSRAFSFDNGERLIQIQMIHDFESLSGNHPKSLTAHLEPLAHNLRSALDIAAWTAYRADHNDTGRHSYFPIGRDATTYPSESERKLKGVKQSFRDAVDGLKPYGGRSMPQVETSSA